jgi:hypothetical protein
VKETKGYKGIKSNKGYKSKGMSYKGDMYGDKGDFGHGENRMYSVTTESQKEGLNKKYKYMPGNMGYPKEAEPYGY